MTISLVEFIDPVRKGTREAVALSILYWNEHYAKRPAMAASEVKSAFTQARVANAKSANIPDVLSKAGAKVDVVGNGPAGSKLWALTETGRLWVRSQHGLAESEPEVQHGVSELAAVASRISDDDTRAYVEEAVLCISVGALRAAIVFVWVAAVAELETRVWAKGHKAVTASIQKANPSAKPVTKKDDLVKLKEVDLLQVAEDVGVIDKAQKQILDQALTTRNQSGHPNKYKPGVAKVKAHVEDIVGVLWS